MFSFSHSHVLGELYRLLVMLFAFDVELFPIVVI